MKRKTLRSLLALSLIALIGMGGWLFLTERPFVVAVVPTDRDVPVRIYGLGTFQARVGFEVGAALTGLEVDNGNFVAQDQVLARLHTTEQETRVARAEGSVEAAEATIGRTRANVTRARAVPAQREATNFEAIFVDRHVEAGTGVRAGEPIFTLMDPTTVWTPAYVDEARAGAIALDGERVFDNRSLRGDLTRLRLDTVGFIFQFHNLLPFLNARDNVALVLTLTGRSSAEAQKQAVELFDYLEVGHRKDAMPALLSGGEAQNIAIAHPLANSPRIILADEPTAALDSKRSGIVMDFLRKRAAEQDAGIVAVTHDEKIYDWFDRLFLLRDGVLEDQKEEET